MVKKMMRSISLMLAVLMMLAAFSACGGQVGKDTQASGSSSTTQPSETQKKDEPKKEVSILLSHANVGYTKSVTNWENDAYVQELEKLTGYDLHFEFLGHAEYLQQLTVRFASGDLPDLIRTDKVDSIAHPTAIENNIFTEIGPLLDQYGPNIKKGIPEDEWTNPNFNSNGKLYGIPALLDYANSRVLYIRQDWLDKFGMKAPVTMDDYLNYFEEVKKLNTDPKADPSDRIYGFTARENMGYSELFFAQFGAFPEDWEFIDGQYVPMMISPKMKEAIKFWKLLYDNQYVNPNLFVLKGNEWTADILNGKSGSWLHDAASYNLGFAASKFVNQPDVKLTMLGGPTGNNGEKGMYPKGSRYYFTFVIPSKVKNPEVVIQFLDKVWASDECDTFFSFGLKDKNYTVENGKVKWDKSVEANSKDNEYLVYQLSLNPKGSNMSARKVLDLMPESDIILKGYETASITFKTDYKRMPGLEVIKTHPEIAVGFVSGNLFLDTFAKALTGKESVDTAFDNFVKEWRSRGGDEAIKEATAWYNSYKNK